MQGLKIAGIGAICLLAIGILVWQLTADENGQERRLSAGRERIAERRMQANPNDDSQNEVVDALKTIASKLDRIIRVMESGTKNLPTTLAKIERAVVDVGGAMKSKEDIPIVWQSDVTLKERTPEMEAHLAAVESIPKANRPLAHLLWTPRQVIARYGIPTSISPYTGGSFDMIYRTDTMSMNINVRQGFAVKTSF